MMKKILKTIACLLSFAAFTGCTLPFMTPVYKEPERVLTELAEPVSFETSPETVAKRDIYNASCCEVTVIPNVKEYAFPEDVKKFTINVLPGSKVNVGDVIAKADDASTERLIEEYTNKLSEAEERIASLEAEIKKAYSAELQRELDKEKELFTLDSTYINGKLEKLVLQREKFILKADAEGTIAGILDGTGPVKAGAAVISVADETEKIIYTDFFKSDVIANAEDYYALINGRRYECKRVECSEKNRSLFEVTDDENSISAGDRGVFVLIENKAEEALSITTTLIKNDESGSYVYVQNGTIPEKRYLSLGISDGFFTEIKSGLSEGEKIADSSSETETGKTGTAQVKDIVKNYESRGFFFYPNSESINCNIGNVTVHFESYTTGLYSYVNEGDVIAKINVSGDEIELERLKLQLQRMEERNESEEKISSLREKIDRLTADYSTHELRADKSGIIVGLTEYKQGDVINKGDVVAQVTDSANCYLAVQNTKDLSFGNRVVISYVDAKRNTCEAAGKVISFNDNASSTTLKTDFLLIQVDPENVRAIMEAQGIMGRAGFAVKAQIPEFKEAVTVPKAAVTVFNGTFSANVVSDDGSVKKVCFLSWGSDKEVYYCLEGIREGETVCLK